VFVFDRNHLTGVMMLKNVREREIERERMEEQYWKVVQIHSKRARLVFVI